MEIILKSRLRRLGFRLLLGGILLTVLGTGTQLYFFIVSNGEAPTNSPAGMIWSGIVAALGILILFAGALLRAIGTFDQEKGNITETGKINSADRAR